METDSNELLEETKIPIPKLVYDESIREEKEKNEALELEKKFDGKFIGFGFRFLAFLIDYVLCYITLATLAGYALSYFITSDSGTILLMTNVVAMFIWWMYHALWESSQFQATIGKLLIRSKVIDYDGNQITFVQASKRYFSKYLSGLIFGIGYLSIIGDYKRQGLHDRIAKTYVIAKEHKFEPK